MSDVYVKYATLTACILYGYFFIIIGLGQL